MIDHAANRTTLVAALESELAGPGAGGTVVSTTDDYVAEDRAELFRDYTSADLKEEVIWSAPTGRYSIGVLYPEATSASATNEEQHPDSEASAPARPVEIDTVGKPERGQESADDYEFTVAAENARKPSSVALSYLASAHEGRTIDVLVRGARYSLMVARFADEKRDWWRRIPVKASFSVPLDDPPKHEYKPTNEERLGPLTLRLVVVRRDAPEGELITVALVNRTDYGTHDSQGALFQFSFEVECGSEEGSAILPYPEPRLAQNAPLEDQEISLLYRRRKTFAIGHGCAASWGSDRPVSRIWSEYLPRYETPSMTADAVDRAGRAITADMAKLAGLHANETGLEDLDRLCEAYADWITALEKEAAALPSSYSAASASILARASNSLTRMRQGVALLRNNKRALRAFRLANKAVLLQQIGRMLRTARVDKGTLTFDKPPPTLDPLAPGPGKGHWRAFQIGFILCNLPSAAPFDDSGFDSPDAWLDARRQVELIWFPTGGGKTEAYLGLAAFAMFLRRLRDPKDAGVEVLMRYTLRLLTAQQFQRAARLTLAMEVVRTQEEIPGRPFSIGIWLGSSSTPNQHERRNQWNLGALHGLRELHRRGARAANPFLVTQCPWCGAEMGPLKKAHKEKDHRVLGYRRVQKKVILHCPDGACLFSDKLPVFVVDSDVYEERPDLVIGTVDKFAMLAWRPEARRLFALNDGGQQDRSPPGLIIQDELHLISGPLGSLVGLYETLIDELCTDKRTPLRTPAKIVSATATIRRYDQQIRDLYGRNSTNLFPPPGLDDLDSFFSRQATNDEGRPAKGRLYVGVYAPGLPSMQTLQVRVFSALLSGNGHFGTTEERDPWHTLMVFYNSLRELGGALSLFQSDIPERLFNLSKKTGLPRRYLNRVMELTGRISNDEVPRTLEKLESHATTGKAYDACLASSIIEVGIDIDRLSLLAVVGQPKTTSQYIQVTGRVGRKWQTRPGLVVTLYSSSKPRDHSHFEKFRSYHERLYAQVEPTSVTPFSLPSVERGLHALLVAAVRQVEPPATTPYPVPSDTLSDMADILRDRVARVDPAEVATVEGVLRNRLDEWRKRERVRWTAYEEDPGLMYRAGSYLPEELRRASWPVPQSVRTVDAECNLRISLPE